MSKRKTDKPAPLVYTGNESMGKVAHSFNETARVMFENADRSNPVNQQVINRLNAIDATARSLRKDGRSPDEIKRQLADQVAELEGAVSLGYQKVVADYQEQLGQRLARMAAQRDRKAEAELLRLRRAENMVAGMSEQELAELAAAYVNDEADLDYETLNEMSRRMDTENRMELRAAMKEKRASDRWWLDDPEAAELDTTIRDMQAAGPGKVHFEFDGAPFDAHITQLVDWEGSLDEE